MSSPEDYFMSARVEPRRMDALWADGWRHFGMLFFRYRRSSYGGRRCFVMPLRVELERFTPSRSQKRVLARNSDAEIRIGETFINREKRALFERHKRRFQEALPDSLSDFLSHAPASVPCRNVEICVYLGGRLAAASFLDVGESATSAVYAMFDPEESKRSLGIFTMLVAIRYSLTLGCRHYYPGYACREPSIYDYKKKFAGVEYFDWRSVWQPLDAA
ncbi:MAG: GNAT family N-acetyltransferase [Acidobacteria bacterium]|nr:GNAT family N-acetyltransferase [Acidobacteriota bacterium]